MTQQRVSPISVTSVLPAVPVLSLQAALGQSANIQEWKNSSGTVLARIDAFGSLVANTAYLGTTSVFIQSGASNGTRFNAASATVIPLQVAGAASQTGDLQQWQNSAGTVNAKVESNGTLTVTGGSINAGGATIASVRMSAQSASASVVALAVRGFTSQTANLQEWQDVNGTVLSKVTSNGTITATSGSINAGGETISSVRMSSQTANAAVIGLVVRGAASQTANLQEWQDSAGTILSFVDSIGRGKFVTGLFGTLGSSIGSNLAVATNATTTIGLIVRGSASQTANLQEWQNSAGTPLSIVNSGGSFNIGGSTAPKSVLSITQGGSAPTSPTLGTASGGFYLANFDAAYGLLGGVVGTGNVWLQVQRTDSGATAYDLHLQPSGGRVAIAKTTASSALDVNGTITASQQIISVGGTNGIGYGTGAGGTVTQATDKTTGVTLSKVTGQITMNGAALAADTTVSFTLTNTAIAATDVVYVQHISAGTLGAYVCTAAPAAGSATVYVRNITAGSLSEAIVLQFVVIKAVTA